MIFVSSNYRGGNVPGGGIGCFLLTIFGFIAVYFVLKGLYWLLYWLSPVLLVLAAVINWRVFPQTLKNLVKGLETNPLLTLIYVAFAVMLFPFFCLYMLLKATGMKQLERMGQFMNNPQGTAGDQGEFTEFEEIESTPKGNPSPSQPIPPPEILEKETPPDSAQMSPPPKPENPYDRMFDEKE